MHMLALKLMFIFIFILLLFIRIAVKPVITLHALKSLFYVELCDAYHIFKKMRAEECFI